MYGILNVLNSLIKISQNEVKDHKLSCCRCSSVNKPPEHIRTRLHSVSSPDGGSSSKHVIDVWTCIFLKLNAARTLKHGTQRVQRLPSCNTCVCVCGQFSRRFSSAVPTAFLLWIHWFVSKDTTWTDQSERRKRCSSVIHRLETIKTQMKLAVFRSTSGWSVSVWVPQWITCVFCNFSVNINMCSLVTHVYHM